MHVLLFPYERSRSSIKTKAHAPVRMFTASCICQNWCGARSSGAPDAWHVYWWMYCLPFSAVGQKCAPSETVRVTILWRLTSGRVHSLTDKDVYEITKSTKDFSALKSLAKDAALYPLRGILPSHIAKFDRNEIRPIQRERFHSIIKEIQAVFISWSSGIIWEIRQSMGLYTHGSMGTWVMTLIKLKYCID